MLKNIIVEQCSLSLKEITYGFYFVYYRFLLDLVNQINQSNRKNVNTI